MENLSEIERKKSKKNKEIIGLDKCPIRNVLDRLGDKWSLLVILTLGEKGTIRFNQINTLIPDISQKMLTVTLRTLEADGLVSRKVYPEIPPRVEYTLTSVGISLLPHINNLVQWALTNMPVVIESRNRCSKSSANKAANKFAAALQN